MPNLNPAGERSLGRLPLFLHDFLPHPPGGARVEEKTKKTLTWLGFAAIINRLTNEP